MRFCQLDSVTTASLLFAAQSGFYIDVFLLRSQMNSDFAAAVLLAVLIIGVRIMVEQPQGPKTHVTNTRNHRMLNRGLIEE